MYYWLLKVCCYLPLHCSHGIFFVKLLPAVDIVKCDLLRFSILIEKIPQTVVQGLSGEIKFDNQGYRTNFAVDIMELTSSGLAKIGIWNTTDGLTITRVYETSGGFVEGSLKNKTFIILTTLVWSSQLSIRSHFIVYSVAH